MIVVQRDWPPDNWYVSEIYGTRVVVYSIEEGPFLYMVTDETQVRQVHLPTLPPRDSVEHWNVDSNEGALRKIGPGAEN